MSRVGYTGTAAVVPALGPVNCANMIIIRPSDGLDSDWIRRLFAAEAYLSQVRGLTAGSAQPVLNIKLVQRLVTPLPPFDEQRRISEILDTLDETIRKTEQLIAKLKQVKHGLLHDLLTRGIDDNGELRDPDRHPEQFRESRLGLLPKTWRGGVLGEFIDGPPQNGLYKPASFYADEGTPIIRIDSFYDGTVEDVARLKRVRLTEQERGLYGVGIGDLLINRVNSIDYVGKSAIVVNVPDAMVFESNIMRLRVRGEIIIPAYAIQILCSSACGAYFQARAKPAIAQVSINQDDVKEAPFAVPTSLAEQAAIVARIQAIVDNIDSEQMELSKLQVLKRGLMDDLLTGRVRVTKLLAEAVA